jgi:hypothetical protein
MNSDAVTDTERWIRVYRGEKELENLAEYVAGETLSVTLSDVRGQFAYEVEGTTFVGGGCEGLRATKRKVAMIMPPADSLNDVKVWAGWATGQTAVRITPAITLLSPLKKVHIMKTAQEAHEQAKNMVLEKVKNGPHSALLDNMQLLEKSRLGKSKKLSIAHRDKRLAAAEEVRAQRKGRPIERMRNDDDDGDGDDDDDTYKEHVQLRTNKKRKPPPGLGNSLLVSLSICLVAVVGIVGFVKCRTKKVRMY